MNSPRTTATIPLAALALAALCTMCVTSGCEKEPTVSSAGTTNPATPAATPPASVPRGDDPTAAPASPPAAPVGTGVLSNDGAYWVVYRYEPDPVPLNDVFSIIVSVHDAEDRDTVVRGVDLLVDGRMPDHRHGMNREPRVTPNEDGSFTVSGMQFHMPGYWQLHFDVTRDGITERAQVDVTLE